MLPDVVIDMGKLVRLMEARGWKLHRLAREAGIDYSTLWRIARGRALNPRHETVVKLAAALGVTVEELSPDPSPPPLLRTIGPGTAEEVERWLTEDTRGRRDPVMVPLVENPASAGGGSPGELGGLAHIPFYPTYSQRGDQWWGVTVQGHCLEPRLRHGQIAIVNAHAVPHGGDIVWVEHQGEALLKVYEPGDGYVLLTTLDGSPSVRADETTRLRGVVQAIQHSP